MKLKIKKHTLITEWMKIKCPCGHDVSIDYSEDEKTKETWCVHCNRYYVRDKDDNTIFHHDGFRCFKCNMKVSELFLGPRFIEEFENYNEQHLLCKDCMKEKIKQYKNRVNIYTKIRDLLIKMEKYDPCKHQK